MTDKLGQYRAHALAAETKAFNARTEETRRAWLIVARDWTAMADRLEARKDESACELDAEARIGSTIASQQPTE